MRSISVCLLCVFTLASSYARAEGQAAWISYINGMMSSIKVTSMQVGASADKVADTKISAAQASSSAAIDLYNREQIRKTWEDYGPEGQLIDPCYQFGMADTSARIKDKTAFSAASAAASVYAMSDDGYVAAPGVSGALGNTVQRSSVPFAASTAKRMQRHQAKYCSVSEAKLGYCTLLPNGMQSADSDFSVLYAPGTTYGWDQTEAASDFVKTIAPVRPMPQATGCTSKTCQAAVRQRREEEPFLSMARYSFLSFTESRTTQASGDARQKSTGQ